MNIKQTKYLIVVFFLLEVGITYSQCSPIEYKTLKDSIFSINDKILCPTIVYNQPGGYRILMDKSESSLLVIAEFLKKNANLKFEIGSHTDQRGNEEFNLRSSQKRAETIKDFLIKEYQIDPEQIEAKGYGETCPIISINSIKNETNIEDKEEMYRCNRRTELTIIKH